MHLKIQKYTCRCKTNFEYKSLKSASEIVFIHLKTLSNALNQDFFIYMGNKNSFSSSTLQHISEEKIQNQNATKKTRRARSKYLNNTRRLRFSRHIWELPENLKYLPSTEKTSSNILILITNDNTVRYQARRKSTLSSKLPEVL